MEEIMYMDVGASLGCFLFLYSVYYVIFDIKDAIHLHHAN